MAVPNNLLSATEGLRPDAPGKRRAWEWTRSPIYGSHMDALTIYGGDSDSVMDALPYMDGRAL